MSSSVFDKTICTLTSSVGDQLEFVERTKDGMLNYTSYSYNTKGELHGFGIGRPLPKAIPKFEMACEIQMEELREKEMEVQQKIEEYKNYLQSVRDFMELVPKLMLEGPRDIDMRHKEVSNG